MPLNMTAPAATYPFANGYCDTPDVQARINAGSWTAKTGSFPTVAQVQGFIQQGAADIDAVLTRSGYLAPIVARAGTVLAGWVLPYLLDINAALAVSKVQSARYGSQTENEDPDAAYWMTYADDKLARIEHGDDNLAVGNADGPFMPVADKSQGMAYTGMTDSDGLPSGPSFRINTQVF